MEVKKEEDESEDELQRNLGEYDLYTRALNTSEDELRRRLEALKDGNEKMHGGLKTRFSKSGDIETFLQRMAKVTKGKSIFTNKQIRSLEYELAKFIKGEKSSNLTQKGTDIANIERLFLTQFRGWYDSNSDNVPIIFQKSFSSVFTDINSLKIKESKSGELEKILSGLVKKDDKTGFYSFIKRTAKEDTEQTETLLGEFLEDTKQTGTLLETLNKLIETKTQQLEDNKRTIANTNRFISENVKNKEAAAEITSKSTEGAKRIIKHWIN